VALSQKELNILLSAQGFEISEFVIYKNLAKIVNQKNKGVLTKLSEDSLKHYQYWEKITGKKIAANQAKVWFYTNMTRVFGLTFGIKMLEQTEKEAEKLYEQIKTIDQGFAWIIAEEKRHEKEVVSLIDEESLKYVGSIVLGSNDALVELTGALSGLTLALQNNQLIGATGLITGLAASLSMASSEYLSTKSENGTKNPLKAALYTGITYVLTVIFLIFPYFIFHNYFISLGVTLFNATLVILFFSFYFSVTQELSFKKRFFENIIISFGIAFLSFGIGFLVRTFLHLEI
jgi:VIT1/CCC1 family predicted Fe2+/Mn2+ transporter